MSYSIYVQKFENRDSAPIPTEDFIAVIRPYGRIEESEFGLEFVSTVGELCDHASIHGSLINGITGISFFRPLIHDQLPRLIFDLLGIENTCFFGPDLDFLQSRSDLMLHLPEELLASFPAGPEMIENPTSAWPLT